MTNNRDTAAAELLEAGQMWRDAPDQRTAGNLILCINRYEDAAAAAPPGDLVGALRECRDWMGDGENQPAQHHPGCEWLLSLVGGTCDCGHDRAITRADAALASAERPGGDDG